MTRNELLQVLLRQKDAPDCDVVLPDWTPANFACLQINEDDEICFMIGGKLTNKNE